MAAQDYVTARRAADMTGLNERTIRRHIASGRLQAERGDDGDYRISVKALEGLRRSAKARATRRGNLAGELASLRAEVAELRATIEGLQTRINAPGSDRARTAAYLPRQRTHTDGEAGAPTLDGGNAPRRSESHPSARLTRYDTRDAVNASKLDADTVYLGEFAERHGVPVGTAKHQALKLGMFPSTTLPRRGRPEQNEHFLVGDQRDAALTYWRTTWRGDTHAYQECSVADCPCHTLATISTI